MADDLTVSEDDTTSESSSPESETKEQGNKKIFIIIGIAAILIIAAIAGVLIFKPFSKKSSDGEDKISDQKQEINIETVQFTTIPEILINLRAADGRSSFLKAQFIIQSPNEEISKKLDKLIPVLTDQFQVYLRELDVEDIKGSIGQQRIRQELINRTNTLIEPEKISNVLFKNFLIQ